MHSSKIVAVAASAAAVLALTLTGVAGAGEGDEPKSPECIAALEVYAEAQADAKAGNSPGQRRDGARITEGEQAAIDKAVNDARNAATERAQNPASGGGTTITPAEEDAIGKAMDDAYDAAYAKAIAPESDGPFVNDGTVITAEERAKVDTTKTAADKACKGADGKSGDAGKDGLPGKPGENGKPGKVVENNTQNNYYNDSDTGNILPSAPTPTIVESDLPVTH